MGFSAIEITAKKEGFVQSQHPSSTKDEIKNHLVLQRVSNSIPANALFFEQIEDNEEDDELKEFIEIIQQTKLLKNHFSYFIPEFNSDYLKPGVITTPYGLRSDQPLFIVFRFIRI